MANPLKYKNGLFTISNKRPKSIKSRLVMSFFTLELENKFIFNENSFIPNENMQLEETKGKEVSSFFVIEISLENDSFL